MTPATLPCESRMRRQPAPFVLVVPSSLGSLPTMTQPVFSMVIAVVSPMPPGHCGKCRGSSANTDSFLRRGIVVDNRCAEALKVLVVIEIGDQNVVFLDRAGRCRRNNDRIRILVAIGGNSRAQGRVVVDRGEEPLGRMRRVTLPRPSDSQDAAASRAQSSEARPKAGSKGNDH